jgi:hypothetical protein
MDGQASRRRAMGFSGQEMLAIGSFQQNQRISICHREVSIKEALIKCRKSACLEKLPSERGDIQGA